ncbi:MAG: RnfABCDGE type electron transport complex subunit B [Ruminococcaceae bacterium]|nr:RnfABCDGE type electron transport complex subunit B [Oscillospiraceae bacterium]
MKEILLPALAMGGVGLVLGILLAVASKIFAVEKDERAEEIAQILPGANCGSCGFAGCSAYASAISAGTAKINECSPGGQNAADRIAEIMGVSGEAVEEKRAAVLCKGTIENAAEKYEYIGVQDCVAASRLQGGGAKACSYGCLGYGSCIKVCSNNAIKIENGIAVIDMEKCGGCGECAAVCPKKLIKIIPKSAKYVVKCQSCDKGAQMKEKCSVGCIGCKICEKNCPADAIKVENNHAVIDYGKCISCGLCAEKCPKKIIELIGAN